MFKVLLVEDNKNIRKLMTTYLRKNNYDVLEAENGEEALDVMDRNHIDLMISDIMMPKMDGYELTKEIRDAGFTMPILFVTAKDSIDDKREGFMLGVDDYMVKPIDMDEMILRVGVLLRRANIINQRQLKIKDVVLSFDEYTNIIRGFGIDIGCYDEQINRLKYPLKFVHSDFEGSYEDCESPSYGDHDQGFYGVHWDGTYDGDEYEDDEYAELGYEFGYDEWDDEVRDWDDESI